jgi:hypothetical protein
MNGCNRCNSLQVIHTKETKATKGKPEVEAGAICCNWLQLAAKWFDWVRLGLTAYGLARPMETKRLHRARPGSLTRRKVGPSSKPKTAIFQRTGTRENPPWAQ